MRISVSSWATTEEDVEMSLAAICRIAEEVPEMTPDWKRLRAEFPALANWTYLNTATYGQMPRAAAEAMARHIAGGTNLRAATSSPGSTIWTRSGPRARNW